MAWNPGKGIIDLFGGLSDIARPHTDVGPDERFAEDALRMLRRLDFGKLNFEIDAGTYIGSGKQQQY